MLLILLVAAAAVGLVAYLYRPPSGGPALLPKVERTLADLVAPSIPALAEADAIKRRAKRLRELAESADLPETLGFSLGQTHRVEVDGWLTRFGDRCAAAPSGRTVRCQHIDELRAGWTPIEVLVLTFNESDRLVAVEIEREPLDVTAATELFYKSDTAMERSLGPPLRSYGALDAQWLGAEPLRQTMREYQARGFSAQIAVTGWGPQRARVHERYAWVPRSAAPPSP